MVMGPWEVELRRLASGRTDIYLLNEYRVRQALERLGGALKHVASEGMTGLVQEAAVAAFSRSSVDALGIADAIEVLSGQVSAANDERRRVASDAVALLDVHQPAALTGAQEAQIRAEYRGRLSFGSAGSGGFRIDGMDASTAIRDANAALAANREKAAQEAVQRVAKTMDTLATGIVIEQTQNAGRGDRSGTESGVESSFDRYPGSGRNPFDDVPSGVRYVPPVPPAPVGPGPSTFHPPVSPPTGPFHPLPDTYHPLPDETGGGVRPPVDHVWTGGPATGGGGPTIDTIGDTGRGPGGAGGPGGFGGPGGSGGPGGLLGGPGSGTTGGGFGGGAAFGAAGGAVSFAGAKVMSTGGGAAAGAGLLGNTGAAGGGGLAGAAKAASTGLGGGVLGNPATTGAGAAGAAGRPGTGMGMMGGGMAGGAGSNERTTRTTLNGPIAPTLDTDQDPEPRSPAAGPGERN